MLEFWCCSERRELGRQSITKGIFLRRTGSVSDKNGQLAQHPVATPPRLPGDMDRNNAPGLLCHIERASGSRCHHLGRRTTKSGRGGANPAVTTYSELPNSAIVVGTFVAGFDANGSVMERV